MIKMKIFIIKPCDIYEIIADDKNATKKDGNNCWSYRYSSSVTSFSSDSSREFVVSSTSRSSSATSKLRI
jgi:hypothetical protein